MVVYLWGLCVEEVDEGVEDVCGVLYEFYVVLCVYGFYVVEDIFIVDEVVELMEFVCELEWVVDDEFCVGVVVDGDYFFGVVDGWCDGFFVLDDWGVGCGVCGVDDVVVVEEWWCVDWYCVEVFSFEYCFVVDVLVVGGDVLCFFEGV